jgi:hypothetical protein
MVEKFSPHRADQPFPERVGQGHMKHSLDFVDLQNPKVRRPTVRLKTAHHDRY